MLVQIFGYNVFMNDNRLTGGENVIGEFELVKERNFIERMLCLKYQQ